MRRRQPVKMARQIGGVRKGRVQARELLTDTEACESRESRTQPCGEVGGFMEWAGLALTWRT